MESILAMMTCINLGTLNIVPPKPVERQRMQTYDQNPARLFDDFTSMQVEAVRAVLLSSCLTPTPTSNQTAVPWSDDAGLKEMPS